jgi:hypothetical protein
VARRSLVAALLVSLALLPLLPGPALARLPSPPADDPIPQPYFPPLSLERVFSPDHSLPENAERHELRTVIVPGDVIPGRGVHERAIFYNDFLYPWRATADLLRQGDLRVINLEAPLIRGCPIINTGVTFCGTTRHIEGLRFAGIDLVGLENNHITNFGFEGLRETQALLSANGIDWARRDRLATKVVRGYRFGLLAFNGIGERIDREAMIDEIKAAKPQVDILMALFHWGQEYERLPKAQPGIAPDNPREIARVAVDAGVDLVLGNHPHWVQAVEFYQGRFIPYSHGNFIFDQMWSEETRTGVVGKYTFYRRTLVDVQFFPVRIHDYAQPRPLAGAEAEDVLAKMRAGSEALSRTAVRTGP